METQTATQSHSSTAALEPRTVGAIRESFFVPSYQRGYRWTSVEVKQLLDDIWANRGNTYYLQPIVVKPRGEDHELIDGQQRLTTLFLIMKFLHDERLKSVGARFSLRYETREQSAQFLENIEPSLADANVDFFHIYRAYTTIAEWFPEDPHERQFTADEIYGALFSDVHIIWYEVGDDVDSTVLFRRLNVGKIHLTDAELIKALLLSRVRATPGIESRAYEIAAQWDHIERELRQPELWAFITGRNAGQETHIGALLDAHADAPQGPDPRAFYTFTKLHQCFRDDPLEAWQRVVELHDLLLGWYQDHDLFHRIGYLIAEGRVSIRSLLDDARDLRRSEFRERLDSKITKHLNLSESDLRDLSYTSAGTNRALLLMNVETIRRQPHSGTRYSFHHHALGDWSLEHIHAQAAENLNSQEQWRSWLELHARLLAILPEQEATPDRDDLISRTHEALAHDPLTEVRFRALEREYTEALSRPGSDGDENDAIGNLALLNSGNNSALSNAVFAVKRERIIELDQQGAYIPICTRNVFLKYYSPPEEIQPHFWSETDREHYVNEMVKTLRPYLKEEYE